MTFKCTCTDSAKLKKIKDLLDEALEWYKANQEDDSLLYDESVDWFNKRGLCYDILKILVAED